MVDFYYPSVKNQRFLTAPLTRGAFWVRCKLPDKLKFAQQERYRAAKGSNETQRTGHEVSAATRR